MTSNSHEEIKPDGKAFDDYFDSIGKKAEQLNINGDKPANGATSEVTEAVDDGEPKIVDEIESMCMNCHENVRVLPDPFHSGNC